MMNASLFLRACNLALFGLASPLVGQTWTGPGQWLGPEGWTEGRVPGEDSAISFSAEAEKGPILAPVSRCRALRGPGVGKKDQSWSLEAGKLVVIEHWHWAISGTGKSQVLIDGAEISVGGEWSWGRGKDRSGLARFVDGRLICRSLVVGPRGRLEMASPAFLEVKESLTLGGGGGEGAATLEMDGGLVRISGSLSSEVIDKTDAVIPLLVLRAGRLECGDCSSFGGKITLEDGVLALRGDATTQLERMMKEGRLTAYGLKEEVLT
ncbi:MAG: hypothetical protein AAF514_17725, partial [Verrucomicrobiota bacterium]